MKDVKTSAFSLFVAELLLAVFWAAGSVAAGATADQDTASSSDAVAGSIRELVKELGYPEKDGEDIVQMAGGWKLDEMRELIVRTKREYQGRRIKTVNCEGR